MVRILLTWFGVIVPVVSTLALAIYMVLGEVNFHALLEVTQTMLLAYLVRDIIKIKRSRDKK